LKQNITNAYYTIDANSKQEPQLFTSW